MSAERLIHLWARDGYVAAYVSEAWGTGRQRRRRVLQCVRVPVQSEPLADTLRRVADQLEMHPLDRWMPPS